MMFLYEQKTFKRPEEKKSKSDLFENVELYICKSDPNVTMTS